MKEIKLDGRHKATKLLGPIVSNMVRDKLIYDKPNQLLIEEFFENPKNKDKIEQIKNEILRIVQKEKVK